MWTSAPCQQQSVTLGKSRIIRSDLCAPSNPGDVVTIPCRGVPIFRRVSVKEHARKGTATVITRM